MKNNFQEQYYSRKCSNNATLGIEISMHYLYNALKFQIRARCIYEKSLKEMVGIYYEQF